QDYAALSGNLQTAGLSSLTPCAVVSRATQADQTILVCRLRDLPGKSPLPSPALLIVGEVVRLAEAWDSTPLVETWRRASLASDRVGVAYSPSPNGNKEQVA